MKYENYKDSGIEWIGEVPSHWEVMPIKRTGSFENGLTYSPTDICDENGVLVLRSSNIQNDKLNFEDNVYVAKCPLSLLVKSGDIIICSRNGSASLVGKCAIVEGNINATYGAFMMRYRPICKSNTVFSYYLLQTALKFYKGLYSTTTINQLTKGVIGQIYVIYPPFPEQQAIATYLNEKCGEINRAIDVQKKKIDLLGELKQTIITNAVTKGLNPNIPMKDSGVEWIGKIPAHWEVRKIKYICQSEKFSVKTGPFGSQLKGQDLQPEGDVCVYNQRNVIDGQFEETQFFVSNNKAKTLTSFYTKPLDLLVTSRGTIGKCAILPKDRPIGILHPCLIALRINQHICDLIWAKIFINDSVCFATNIFLNSNSTTIEVIYTDTLKNIVIPIPPIQEQQKIITHIENETGKIDSQISKANRRIELLEELKQSIITEAVTGKIKVC